ncbi:MAG: YwiC-like family protein [Actinomycetaceae bacterium]|nr:YwiC-like family protein [Actinomycetaceae bacterium]
MNARAATQPKMTPPKKAPEGAPSKQKTGRPPRKKRSKRYRRLVQHGWISDQHGAWPIAIVPLVFGLITGSLVAGTTSERSWGNITLTVLAVVAIIIAWMSAFLDFSALTAWLKSKRKPRYHKAIITYTSIAAACALIIAIAVPRVIVWLILLVPFFTATTVLTWTGRDRSFITRVCSIVASLIMIPLLTDVVSSRVFSRNWSLWSAFLCDLPFVWFLAGGLGAYYVASVPYVKTMIRERGSKLWIAFSIGIHALFLAITIWGYTQGFVSWLMITMWIILLGRATAMPYVLHRKGKPIHPKYVGKLEVYLSIFIFIGLILSIPGNVG